MEQYFSRWWCFVWCKWSRVREKLINMEDGLTHKNRIGGYGKNQRAFEEV